MHILIAEDESLHASFLQIIVQEMGYYLPKVIGNAEKLLEEVATQTPDLVLLDISLRGMKNGIEIAEIWNEAGLKIPFIFITSMTDKNIFERAAKTNPANYITKPFKAEDVKRAIALALNNHAHQLWENKQLQQIQEIDNSLVLQNAFFVKTNKEIVKVEMDNIMYLEVVEKFTKILTPTESHMVRTPLNSVAEKLPTQYFLQVHRNFIVNLRWIEKVDVENSEIIIGKHRIPISKRMKEALFKRFNLLG
jgi:DNA-binding LytR/AlgR family response regulator